MDVKKVTDALALAQTELNTVTDAEFKARRMNGLRSLALAANAIALAETHLAKAVKQTTPKAEASTETAAPAAGAKKK